MGNLRLGKYKQRGFYRQFVNQQWRSLP